MEAEKLIWPSSEFREVGAPDTSGWWTTVIVVNLHKPSQLFIHLRSDF